MRRETAAHIRAIADTMPTVFDLHDDWVMWQGKDLLLTPMADRVDDKEAWYKVWCPKYVAVEHYHQMKDAYKRDGWPGVLKYQKSVLKMIGLTDEEIENLIKEKKEELYN